MGLWKKLRAAFANDADPLAGLDYDKSWILVYKHAIVGCAVVTSPGYLQYLYVDEEFRHQGHGTRLLHACLPCVKTLHCDADVLPFYTRAASFDISDAEEGRKFLSLLDKRSQMLDTGLK